MGDTGDARVQIDVTEETFRRAHEKAAQEGYPSTSAWLRHVLMQWDGHPLHPRKRRKKQISCRFDPKHLEQLHKLAERSKLSRSEAFALLIERALNDETAPDTTNNSDTAQRIEIPPTRDLERWASLILEAAGATPHKFGPDKAFIAGVLDQLVVRLQPDDPDALRAEVRRLLPELNRHDLVALSRADLVSAMDPDLVERSAIRYLNAEFHLVDLSRVS